jgi:HTH-type transcriptional regulator, cell division transcriptional repressor
MDVGNRIKSRRTEIGMTLKEVAKKLGVKDATVQRYESGNIKNLKYETITKLAEILNVSPNWIVGWESNKEANSQIPIDMQSDELNFVGLSNILDSMGMQKFRRRQPMKRTHRHIIRAS